MSDEYKGWKNYETWNVALWIGNDESLYEQAKLYKQEGYTAFVESLRELNAKIAYQTPDGVAWDDSSIDIDALNKVLENL